MAPAWQTAAIIPDQGTALLSPARAPTPVAPGKRCLMLRHGIVTALRRYCTASLRRHMTRLRARIATARRNALGHEGDSGPQDRRQRLTLPSCPTTPPPGRIGEGRQWMDGACGSGCQPFPYRCDGNAAHAVTVQGLGHKAIQLAGFDEALQIGQRLLPTRLRHAHRLGNDHEMPR